MRLLPSSSPFSIRGDEVALGVAVLAGLRRGHVRHFAGVALDHDVAALADLTRLTGESLGRPSIRTREI